MSNAGNVIANQGQNHLGALQYNPWIRGNATSGVGHLIDGAIRLGMARRRRVPRGERLAERLRDARHLLDGRCRPADVRQRTMKRAFFLTAMLLTALSSGVGQAVTVQDTLTITITPSSILLPSDRDASANWKMAGLLSQGGIPNRSTVCATLSPLGGGSNDQPQIQSAINSCSAGQVVSLSAGTFTISEGSYVLINKGITV